MMKPYWLNLTVLASLTLSACGGSDTTGRTTGREAAAARSTRPGAAGTGKAGGYAGSFGSRPPGGTLGAGNMPNAGPLACTGLQCQQHDCPSGTTTISPAT